MSLVSHSWQKLALPVLWHEVQLKKPSQMEQFIHKLQSESLDTDLRISLHVFIIYVCRALDSDRNQNQSIRFQQIILKLVSLKHIFWRGYSSRNVPIFQAFQQFFPTIRSVDLDYVGIRFLTGAFTQPLNKCV